MSTAFSMRRMVVVSAALFLVILALLAWRVHAGLDPTQLGKLASQPVSAPPPNSGATTRVYGDDGIADDDGGSGYVLPGQSVAPTPGGQTSMPPTTHMS